MSKNESVELLAGVGLSDLGNNESVELLAGAGLSDNGNIGSTVMKWLPKMFDHIVISIIAVCAFIFLFVMSGWWRVFK